MIESKPASNAYRSLYIVCVAFLVIGIYLGYLYIDSNAKNILALIGCIFFGVVAIVVFARTVATKVAIEAHKNKLVVRYTTLGQMTTYYFTDLNSWREEVIKSKGMNYKVILLDFGKFGRLKISNRENTNYDKLKALFEKELKKLKTSS
ncbi:MAG: hypothetical protein LAT68_02590 [Cyclobacteriaceae bacterium]|nr:hypothetical protein [Cyclobacteriaceae bacterium]MCH8515192.1 hypothetical protein [Cyclobacteriaceae bacterium]